MQKAQKMDNTETRCGFVAVLGAPNAGKSTLVNLMVGAKVSIVSPKVQTTRSRVRGIVVQDNTEIVLVDVPGIFKPKRRLDRAMVATAWTESNDADERMLLIDVKRGLDDDSQRIINQLEKDKRPTILVLNKIDTIEKEKLLPLIEKLKSYSVFKETFMISAKTGENVKELLNYLVSQMPVGAFMFPSDNLSDLPNRLFAAEITREKLYMNLQKELPYSVAVETNKFERNEAKGDIRIEQTIYVEREGQKAIVIGKNGSMLKKIGSAVRYELTQIFECPVHVFLFVKVRENWVNDPERYAEWGLDFNA
ncbi:MAG: GTPase Era [Alphaproteobacteria bacterium]|nr:GTPase Era [Alphaproteobacteria bacterium]